MAERERAADVQLLVIVAKKESFVRGRWNCEAVEFLPVR